MRETVIEIRDLRKSYGPVQALDGLDVSVPPGAVGLLGPNGAGKTTLLKLLLGLLEPDTGAARIAGCDPSTGPGSLAVRRQVGYMPEGDCLLPGMTGVELVVTLGRVTGLSREDAVKRTHEVLDYVGLDEQRYRYLDEYSTGMKQRLKLAQALVHDPPLLLLDEPTNGLDPKGRRHMLELVGDLSHEQGKNLLLCSHLLPDVERTCDRVLVMSRGRLIETGRIADLTGGSGRHVRIQLEPDGPSSGLFERALQARGYGCERDGVSGFRVTLPEKEDDADALFAAAAASGSTVVELEPVRSSLEDVFLRVLREAGN